jgi:transcriptional regulator with XRE-family HTH domain
MLKRITNKKLLKASVKEVGLERVAIQADCSASFLQKLLSESYAGIPSIRIIDGICQATHHSIDELFPLVSTPEKESA